MGILGVDFGSQSPEALSRQLKAKGEQLKGEAERANRLAERVRNCHSLLKLCQHRGLPAYLSDRIDEELKA